MNWKGKTILITGATRGIGREIGLKFAAQGATIGVIGKTDQPHPKLDGTVHTSVQDMKNAGGDAIALICDIRDEEAVNNAVEKLVAKTGRIDAVINNASAISLTPTEATSMKRFDLMQSVNSRGTFLVTRACIPYLKKQEQAHILTMSPPIDLDPKWLGGHAAYTLSKYGMSMLTLGFAAEFEDDKIYANTLWPLTTIATAAVENLLGGDTMMQMSRTPQIVADAAFEIFSGTQSGKQFIDEEVLRKAGTTDFDQYRVNTDKDLMPDLFIDPKRVLGK